MNAITPEPITPGFVEARWGASVGVAVIYDGPATRERAAAVHEHILSEFSDELKSNSSWWKVDNLTVPEIAEAATAAAVGADMILFSLNAGEELPEVLKDWAQRWAGKRLGSDGALIALMDGLNPEDIASSPAFAFLQEIARATDMDFFYTCHPRPVETWDQSIENIHLRAETVTVTLSGILAQAAAFRRGE